MIKTTKISSVVHESLLVGIFSAVIVSVFMIITRNTIFPYDSGYYFFLSESFFFNERFSLFNFPSSIRGIIFPLILGMSNRVSVFIFGNPIYGWHILISLLSFPFMLSYYRVFGKLRIGIHRIIPYELIILILVWSGLFIAPLSDFVALFFLIFALSFLLLSYDFVLLGCEIRSIIFAVMAGGFFYISYNTRTIYVVCAFGFLGLFIYFTRAMSSRKGKLITLLVSFLIGFIIFGIPQGIVNYYHLEIISIAVPTGSLNQFQLYQGIRMNFYETCIMPNTPSNFTYFNRSGLMLLESVGIRGEISYRQYISLLLRYPFEMVGVLTRHFIVMMNPISGGAYITSRNNTRFLLTMLNYTILFLLGDIIKQKILSLELHQIRTKIINMSVDAKINYMSAFTLLLPFFAIIPGAVEERFALPFWLVSYFLVLKHARIRLFIERLRKYPFKYILCYVGGLCLFIAILTEIYANNNGNIFLPILRVF